MNHDIFRSFIKNRPYLTLLLISVLTLFAVNSPAQVDVNFSDATGNPGDQVEVDVTVEDFENMISMQYSVNWDPAVIEFDTFTNILDPIAGPNVLASPNQIGEDYAMTVSWFTDDFVNGTDIADGSVLFTIVFDVVGQMCDESPVELSTDPRDIEFIQLQGGEDVEIMVNSDPGLVNVPGTDCDGGSDLELIGSMETAEPGDEVCVEVSVQNFDSILSLQYVHIWDSDVLEFSEVRNFNLPNLSAGNFNVDMTTGHLRLTWNDLNAEGVSVSDGTVIYEVCFNVVGSIGDMTDVEITGDSEIDLEVIQIQNGNDVSIDPVVTDGKVTVEGLFTGPIVTAESGSASTGSEYCMDVTVQNFDSLESMAFSLGWDPEVLDYLRLENLNTDLGLSTGNFNFTNPETSEGDGGFIWATQTGLPVSLPDGTVLFTVCFEIIGDCGQTAEVIFTDDPTAKETSSDGEAIQTQYNKAEIEIPCFSVNHTVTDVQCNGDCDGSIDLTPSGGQTPYTYDWDPDNLDGTEDPQDLCAGTYSVTVTEGGGTFVAIDITVNEPDPLEIILETVDEDDGTGSGAIDLTIQGGTAGYSTTWTGPTSISDDTQDPTGLASGTYNVTVTDDNGCTATLEIFVPGTFNFNGEVTDACSGSCDGSIDISVEGGTEPYDYFWDGPTDIDDGTENPTDLCPGTYMLTVEDADGNTTMGSVTVDESDPVVITVDDIQADFDGMGSGSISITVSGGTPGYDYSWSGPTSIPDGTEDPSGLLSGTYMLTVTDANGCTNTAEIVVDPPFSIVDVIVTDISCAGFQDGAIDITVVGGEEPYSYSWSNGSETEDINTLAAGTYTVTVTDNTASTITATFTIVEPDPLQVDIEEIRGSNPGSQNGSARAIVSGGTRPYSYEWSSSNETDSLAENLAAGLNILIVTDARGCSIMDSVEIDQIDIRIDCYEGRKVITPNGDNLNDRFVIECIDERPNTLSIYNQWGQLIYQKDNYDNSWQGTDDDGDEVDENTYLWVLEVELQNGATKIYRGAITVLRNLH